MNNLEATVAALARKREERRWTDEGAAADVLAALGLDPDAEVHPTRINLEPPPPPPNPDAPKVPA